jgi:hypothetical protein
MMNPLSIKQSIPELVASNSMQEFAKRDSESKIQALNNIQTKLLSTKLTINISL